MTMSSGAGACSRKKIPGAGAAPKQAGSETLHEYMAHRGPHRLMYKGVDFFSTVNKMMREKGKIVMVLFLV